MSGDDQPIGYADHLSIVETSIERVVEIAQDTFLIRLEAPAIAAATVPGQFVMIRFLGREAPLIGRALAVYNVIDDRYGSPRAIDLVFVRKGAFTTPLAVAPVGTAISVWGPLGNGFSNRPCDILVMAVGGIGQTPMLTLGLEALGVRQFGSSARARGWAKRVKLLYGARTAALLACVDDFKNAGFEVDLCTDDGTAGTRARIPDRLFERLDQESDHTGIRVVTCGPEIMMEKVAAGCLERNLDCQVSMETPMACGIGICFSCVAKLRPEVDQAWDYRRTCVEGPVFDASKLVW